MLLPLFNKLILPSGVTNGARRRETLSLSIVTRVTLREKIENMMDVLTKVCDPKSQKTSMSR